MCEFVDPPESQVPLFRQMPQSTRKSPSISAGSRQTVLRRLETRTASFGDRPDRAETLEHAEGKQWHNDLDVCKPVPPRHLIRNRAASFFSL